MSAGNVAAQVSNVARVARAITPRSVAVETRKHIVLRGIAPTTTVGDVKRAIAGKLDGVADVAINYWRFGPSGRAIITLLQPEFLQGNLRALGRLTIGGIPARAQAIHLTESERGRMRGSKGRAEAAERGIVSGNGPHGNYPNTEKNVVLWGLPGKFSIEELEMIALREFKLARSKNGKAMIVKLEVPEDRFTMYARFIVTMSSVSEAHRVVRRLHFTNWDKQGHYPIKARVLS